MGTKNSTPDKYTSSPASCSSPISVPETTSTSSSPSSLHHQGQSTFFNLSQIPIDLPSCTFLPSSKSSKFHQIRTNVPITHDTILDTSSIQTCKILFQFPQLNQPTSLRTVNSILKPRIGHFSSLLNSQKGVFAIGQGVGTSSTNTTAYFNDVVICFPFSTICCAVPSTEQFSFLQHDTRNEETKMSHVYFPIFSCQELTRSDEEPTVQFSRCWNRPTLHFDTETMAPTLIGFGGQTREDGNMFDVTSFSFSNTCWQRVTKYESMEYPAGRVAHISLLRNTVPNYQAKSKEDIIQTRWKQKLLIFGGYNGGFLNDMWEYDPPSQKWKQIFPINTPPTPRCSHSANLFSSHSGFVMFGGWIGSTCRYNDTWLYEFETQKWSLLPTTGKLPTPRQLHSSELIRDEYLLIMCGEDSTGLLNDCYLLDLISKEWKQIDLFPVLSFDHTFYELQKEMFKYHQQVAMSTGTPISPTTNSAVSSPSTTTTTNYIMRDDEDSAPSSTICTPNSPIVGENNNHLPLQFIAQLLPSFEKRRGATTICIDDPKESCVKIILFGGIGDTVSGRREALGDMYQFKINVCQKTHKRMQDLLLFDKKVEHFCDVQFYFTE